MVSATILNDRLNMIKMRNKIYNSFYQGFLNEPDISVSPTRGYNTVVKNLIKL